MQNRVAQQGNRKDQHLADTGGWGWEVFGFICKAAGGVVGPPHCGHSHGGEEVMRCEKSLYHKQSPSSVG